jgi:transcriptional regulator of acetoin/glycerol metabolism
LRNVIQRAALLAPGPKLTVADLALPDDDLERTAIEGALARAGGVIVQAAAELGLSRQGLYRRMEKLGISRG